MCTFRAEHRTHYRSRNLRAAGNNGWCALPLKNLRPSCSDLSHNRYVNRHGGASSAEGAGSPPLHIFPFVFPILRELNCIQQLYQRDPFQERPFRGLRDSLLPLAGRLDKSAEVTSAVGRPLPSTESVRLCKLRAQSTWAWASPRSWGSVL